MVPMSPTGDICHGRHCLAVSDFLDERGDGSWLRWAWGVTDLAPRLREAAHPCPETPGGPLRRISAMVSAALFVATTATVLTVSPADAAARKFPNCTAMHAVYKGGVARPGYKEPSKLKYKPFVNLALYNANKSLDRDHDGVACER